MTIGAAAAVGTAALLYCFPLFHVVSLDQAEQSSAAAEFDPVAFVEKFWTDQLIPGAAQATDAAELLAIVKENPEAARQAHGRSVGLGHVYYYFVAGSGRIVSVEKNRVGLSLRDGHEKAQVSLEAGNIFGNAVRDGTGLLDVNDFANSRDFNALSAEINGRIERHVLPTLRDNAAVGKTVRFVGCAEIMDEQTDLDPLPIVPFIVEMP